MLSDAAPRSALENPCLAQGQEMECAAEFGVTTFNKYICLAAITFFPVQTIPGCSWKKKICLQA